MKPLSCFAAVFLATAIAVPASPDDSKESGFVPMFDGQTLKGWVNVNCAPSTFFVKDNQIITTGKPTGYLRTEKQYENFIAEFDWMHIPPKPGAVGNSGFFVWADPIPAVGTGYTRGIEVQVLVNLTYKNKKGEITATSQGDLFSIHGASCVPERPHPEGWARCLPSENHCKGENEWNHYRVEANDGVIKLAVNGHFVSSVSKCKPRKGYLALESEGSECRFKNLKINELPSTNPRKDEICDIAEGHKALYTGLDLSGWKADDEIKKHWQSRDTVLHYDGKGEANDNGLRTDKAYGNAEFIVDFRFPAKGSKSCTFFVRDQTDNFMKITIGPDGRGSAHAKQIDTKISTTIKAGGEWNRLQATLTGETIRVTVNGTMVQGLSEPVSPPKGAFALRPKGGMDFANLFVRELQ
jgi:hypothetical protein